MCVSQKTHIPRTFFRKKQHFSILKIVMLKIDTHKFNTEMFAAYQPTTFNSLPHFNIAKKCVDNLSGAIEKLGGVIKKHNLSHAGVALLHKHFDITHDEILVESEADTTSELSPSDIKLHAEGSLTPYMWKVTEDGKFAPVEFTCTVEEKIVNRIKEVQTSDQFLKEFIAMAKELKVTLSSRFSLFILLILVYFSL